MRLPRGYQIDWSYVFLLVLFLYPAFPWFAYRFRMNLTIVFFVVWFVLTRKRIVVSYKLSQLRRSMCWSLFWIAVFVLLPDLYALVGYGDFIYRRFYTIMAMTMMNLFVLYFALTRGRILELYGLLFCSLTAIVITAFFSHGAIAAGYEGGARALTGYGDDINSFYEVAEGMTRGFGGYDFTYMVVLLVPMALTMIMKARGVLKKLFGVVLLLAIVYIVVVSNLGTPLMIMAVGLALYAVWLLTRKSKLVIINGLVVTVCLFTYIFAPQTFSFLSGFVRSLGNAWSDNMPEVKMRLLSMAAAFEGDTNTYAFARYKLQLLSFKTFLENPICGIGLWNNTNEMTFAKIGWHSLMMDTLARGGIIYGSIFFAQYYATSRFVYKLSCVYSEKVWRGPVVVACASYVFMSLANPFNTISPAITLFVPLAFLFGCNFSRMRVYDDVRKI